MEYNDRDKELIMRHMDGGLSKTEEREVAYRLQEEPGLQNLLSEYQSLKTGIRLARLNENLLQLRSLEANLPPVESKVIPIRKYWIPVSVAAALIIALGLWYVLPRSADVPYHDLYLAYFEPFDSPGSGLTRSTDDEKTIKAKAYQAYDAGEFEKASQLFVALLKQKDDPIAQLCLGSTWLKLDKPKEAETVFTHILEKHGDLVTQAKWYLALTFLRQGKIERTKATLWEISNSSTYGKEARELLKKLD
jgi:tetratricopeptide (TPR) repeat protein